VSVDTFGGSSTIKQDTYYHVGRLWPEPF
jgi:hypothetical protein